MGAAAFQMALLSPVTFNPENAIPLQLTSTSSRSASGNMPLCPFIGCRSFIVACHDRSYEQNSPYSLQFYWLS